MNQGSLKDPTGKGPYTQQGIWDPQAILQVRIHTHNKGSGILK